MAKVVTYGASVRGPRNKSAKRKNQDVWLHTTGAFGSLIVVCDGLGSRDRSRHGASAACKATRQAVQFWPGCHSGAKPEHLIHLIEVLWRFALNDALPSECATTCCFALRESTGHVLLAGLGDVMAAVVDVHEHVTVYNIRNDDAFGNETLALGTSHRICDWWFEMLDPDKARHIMLASDGVADDLDHDRIGDFIQNLSKHYGSLAPSTRWRALSRELREWPVPHHVDDKTIVMMSMEDLCPSQNM